MEGLSPSSEPSKASVRFHLFKNRNYRLYFSGQFLSLSGMWMQTVAQSWLVYRMTHSGYWLGVITFASQLPALFMSPLAGVFADRFDRRKILITVTAIGMVQAFLLAALVFLGWVQIWHVVVLAIGLGLATGFDMVARHAFVVDMVGKSDLRAAVALNSILMNSTRVLGPTLAGLVLGFVDESWCFVINGLTCVPIIVGLAMMKLKKAEPPLTSMSLGLVLRELADGFVYAKKTPVIFRFLLLSAVVCLLACPFSSILPVFAGSVFQGGPKSLAWMTSLFGMGAVAGSLIYLRGVSSERVKPLIIRKVLYWGLGLILLGTSHVFWLSLVGMFWIGYAMMGFFVLLNGELQQIVTDSKRGRVMSLYTMSFLGTVPFGSLGLGWLTDRIGASHSVIVAGCMTVSIALVLVIRELFMKETGYFRRAS